MDLVMKLILGYWAIISLIAFAACWYDKHKARRQGWRVPERTLLLLCALGGSLAFWAGMYLFHHKTRKPKFYLGVPAIIIAQAALLWFAFR